MNNIQPDEFGPAYVIEVADSKTAMQGFLVIDNLALGPGKGGIRMTPGVTTDEVFRLARTMTWKNALAGIPFGGAKAGLVVKDKDPAKKQAQVEAFARALKPLLVSHYIAGPDVNSGENEMKWFVEAVGNPKAATGKPADYCYGPDKKECGLPHELGSTGYGVAQAVAVALELTKRKPQQVTVAIEGFGNVGRFAFKHLEEMGAKIIAVSDSRGTAFSEKGFDYQKLLDLKNAQKSVTDYPGAKISDHQEIFGLEVDVLVLATVTDVINNENKDNVKAKIIAEGANIPMTEAIEDELFSRGLLIIPDMVANAGGVISSYAEHMGYSPEKMFGLVKEKIVESTRAVLSQSLKDGRNPRQIALEIAQEKVRQATNR